ncbi:hypothetical protein CL617_01355 [archaeon]|nr:hypothetical protein [archaeon]|tara:strand:- start:6934 stop:7341 length:408 start_codon:yes stop_codon:yes gene_type:complete
MSNNYKILVVDDDYKLRPLIIRSLEDNLGDEYSFLEASNGEKALDKINKENINLIISDTRMPNIDGYELFEKIRKNSNLDNTDFIAMSNDIYFLRTWDKKYGKSSEYGERGIEGTIDKSYDIPDKLCELIEKLNQ